MFRLLPDDLKVPYMSMSVPFGILSLLMVILSFVTLATKGLNYGVDFAGGIQMVLGFSEDSEVTVEALREKFENSEFAGASVQSFGGQMDGKEFIVHFSGEFADEEKLQELFSEQLQKFGTLKILEFRLSGLDKITIILSEDFSFDEFKQVVAQIDWGVLKVRDVTQAEENPREFEVYFEDLAKQVVSFLEEDFAPGDSSILVKKLDFVGARVGGDLKVGAILSMLLTIFLIFVYIFLRFDMSYAPGVVLSLAHDVIITVGILSFLQIEFDLTIVAGLLTLAGYTINDTIVIFDRIRELTQTLRGKKLRELIDLALNQTLSRTVITGLTTFMTTAVLWAFGGPVIQGFAFTLCIGVIIGTYSSIFVAAALVLWTDQFKKRFGQDQKKRIAA